MRTLLQLGVVVLALTVAAPALAASPMSLERAALAKLRHAPLDAPTRASARGEIARAAHLIRTLPNGRGYHVMVALREVASFRAALTQPRALALYGELRANDDYFARHWAPADKTDIVGADGVVYRYFAGYCFRFHPLAEFGELNARATAGDSAGTQELADALVARGVYQRRGGIGWEYDFPFAGGRAPWLSGMAQAVAAQAFARAAAVVPDEAPTYMREAAAAFRTIPHGLLTRVAAGPWIRLYAFSALAVLNAQLQTAISLQSYATAASDPAAATLAARLQAAAAATLPRFDTGYWSYYSLAHDPSPPDYHHYVVQLLTKLAPADPRFADAAVRFAAYEHQPPAFQLANAGVGQVRFWLSKPATVVAQTAAGPSQRLALLEGWHTLAWAPRRAGVYPVHLTATDWDGNRSETDTLPIVHVGGQFTPVTPASTPDEGAPPFVIAQRATIAWPDAATTPDPAAVAALAALPSPLVLELDVTTPPSDALAQYTAALVQQLPALRYLVVGPAPTVANAAAYVATEAAVRDAVHAVLPDVAVGMLLDGNDAPKTTATALAKSGAAADVLAFRPATTTTAGSWLLPDTTALGQAFSGTVPPLLLDEPTSSVLASATCATSLAGAALDPTTTDAATAAAAATVAHGRTVCPGVADSPGVTASFPTQVSSGTPVSFQLACARDCLFVAALVGADGRTVVAYRGTLAGGAAPASVLLPRTQLGQSSYVLDVRVVARVNPGSVVEVASAPLPRG